MRPYFMRARSQPVMDTIGAAGRARGRAPAAHERDARTSARQTPVSATAPAPIAAAPHSAIRCACGMRRRARVADRSDRCQGGWASSRGSPHPMRGSNSLAAAADALTPDLMASPQTCARISRSIARARAMRRQMIAGRRWRSRTPASRAHHQSHGLRPSTTSAMPRASSVRADLLLGAPGGKAPGACAKWAAGDSMRNWSSAHGLDLLRPMLTANSATALALELAHADGRVDALETRWGARLRIRSGSSANASSASCGAAAARLRESPRRRLAADAARCLPRWHARPICRWRARISARVCAQCPQAPAQDGRRSGIWSCELCAH